LHHLKRYWNVPVVRYLNRKQLITVPTNLKEMVCSAKGSLALSRIMSAIAGSTSEFVKGIVCDRCGVEVTEKKVRRERMGHINLVVPVAHIWYFKSLPNKIGYLLGLPTKKLESIIYYERYVVINPGVKQADGVEYLDFLTEEEYLDIVEAYPRRIVILKMMIQISLLQEWEPKLYTCCFQG
jgi:hypothetical protein